MDNNKKKKISPEDIEKAKRRLTQYDNLIENPLFQELMDHIEKIIKEQREYHFTDKQCIENEIIRNTHYHKVADFEEFLVVMKTFLEATAHNLRSKINANNQNSQR